MSSGALAGVMSEVDPGRFLHIIFWADFLDGFSSGGLGGINANASDASSAVTKQVINTAAAMKQHPGFQNGVSLVVSCGFGRGFMCGLTEPLPANWNIEGISAHDLITLSWISDFNRLSLWRLLDARNALQLQGTELFNVNGLLNLVAWSRELKGHLVPHGQLPDNFREQYSTIQVRQNSLRNLRHIVLKEWNPRRVLDSAGHWVKVRKLDSSLFEEDRHIPLYASEEDVVRGILKGVYVAPKCPWWVEINVPSDTDNSTTFQYWRMLCTWLGRAAPILDDSYLNIPPRPITIRIIFTELSNRNPS